MNSISRKIIAGVAAFATVAGTVYAAPETFVDSVTGGTGATDVVWDGNYNPGYATGSSSIDVTATVAPVLTMSLDQASFALGNLYTDGTTYQSGAVTITGATNSTNGMSIDMTSLGLSYSGQYLGNYGVGTPTVDALDQYRVSTAATPNFSATGAIATNSMDVAASQNIYSSNVPVAPNATTVTIGAVAGITTPAGDYSDTLTFTVTANF